MVVSHNTHMHTYTHTHTHTHTQVKEFAKRAKAWRNKKWPKSAGGKGRPKSYLICLLVLRAHEKASTIVGHGASTHAIARE